MVIKIKEVRRFCGRYVLQSKRINGFRECVKSCNITLDRALYVPPVGRQDFGLVYPEIQIIEGRITA